MITAGAAALAAADDESGPLFEAALALPQAARWPWVRARIQLAYGQWLRRTRDSRARPHLDSAFDTFDRTGAKAMAERARNELRASGVGSVRVDTSASALTAEQRQSAELAVFGLSNKQIGERLFLSHRTVGSHLLRLFPKLGITSRAALSSALKAIRTLEERIEAHSGHPRPAKQPQRQSSAVAAVGSCRPAGAAVRGREQGAGAVRGGRKDKRLRQRPRHRRRMRSARRRGTPTGSDLGRLEPARPDVHGNAVT
ncbi:response regulator transcription factor [Streptomyces sp. GbtcB6]|uniref:response regulator transcription factor n=1 Tax=Streptomyces sp. GbtcB6 TaxID=2824751 RepID=UPI001C2F4E54|nr:LuxR C-terminal-related transcriptional regulator [Streptomyces sp. GbtcB6]